MVGDETNAESINANTKDKLAARREYARMLAVPEGWMEEVIVVPPSFAPSMTLVGMEHLRLPPEFRNPDSPWFCSYLLAIELTEPTELTEQLIAEQLLVYFRGLASGGKDRSGEVIRTDRFVIVPQGQNNNLTDEFSYLLTWQEPFVNATPLEQRIRVKALTGKNEHGVLFVCVSPQSFDSQVWKDLLEMRLKFERAR